jgi:hypothetical protein
MLKQVFQLTREEVVGEEFYNRYQLRTINRTIKERNKMGGTCVILMLILEIVYVNSMFF